MQSSIQTDPEIGFAVVNKVIAMRIWSVLSLITPVRISDEKADGDRYHLPLAA
jgi:hypothetical protein